MSDDSTKLIYYNPILQKVIFPIAHSEPSEVLNLDPSPIATQVTDTMSNPPLPPSATSSSLVPAIPVPTHGPGGSFAVLAKTTISAQPIAVLNAVRDTSTWKEWNSFCPRCVFQSSSHQQPPKFSKDNLGGGSRDGEGGIQDEMWSGKEDWLELKSAVTIDVYMSGDGLIEGRKPSREQGLVISHLAPLAADASGSIQSDGAKEGERKAGYRIAWTSTGWSHWQLHSERVMDFIEMEDGGTEYVCWETFGGVLGSVVKATVGATLVERFRDYAKDLKGFCERKQEGKTVAGLN